MNQLRIFSTAATTAFRRERLGVAVPYSGVIDDQLVAIAWISGSRLTEENCS